MFSSGVTLGVFCRGFLLLQAKHNSPYAFFEDAYPKAKPPERVATYEEQLRMATVKNLEPRKQLTESEKLHRIHDWKLGEDPDPGYGWAEEWGPDPLEEGHDRWYEKPKAYMNGEESFKFENKIQTPLVKQFFRHQEMPYAKRMKAASYNMAVDNGQFYDVSTRDSWSYHSPEEKTDYVGKAKEEFIEEWLSKPGVTQENMTTKMAEYNGSAKGKQVKKIDRVPEWELAPREEFRD
jgi:hypothetical protein